MIQTARLTLRPPEPAHAAAMAVFQQDNRAHLQPWDPPRSADFFTEAGQAARLVTTAAEVDAGRLVGWWLFDRAVPERLVGLLNFSQIVRGVSHGAVLGYAIGADHQGRGLMAEALDAALAEVFGPRINLHRVQANVRPENTRSLKLLDRLGFRREGLARDYLFIDGAWCDHVITARLNPAWRAAPFTQDGSAGTRGPEVGPAAVAAPQD